MPNQTQIIWLGYFYKLKLDLFNLIFIGAFNLVNNKKAYRVHSHHVIITLMNIFYDQILVIFFNKTIHKFK